MALVCSCPAATALTTIPAVTCAESFGQIQKIAFQRLYVGTTPNGFTRDNLITALASWTALKSSTTGTKVVVSPYITSPATEGGDAITEGGGNDSVDGIATITGRNPVNFTCVMRNVPQTTIRAMKTLQCEALAGNLGVYLFNENGQIMSLAVEAGGVAEVGTARPIPVRSLFVGDKMLGGFGASDTNTLSWSFMPNWSDLIQVSTPTDFNPLTDL